VRPVQFLSKRPVYLPGLIFVFKTGSTRLQETGPELTQALSELLVLGNLPGLSVCCCWRTGASGTSWCAVYHPSTDPRCTRGSCCWGRLF